MVASHSQAYGRSLGRIAGPRPCHLTKFAAYEQQVAERARHALSLIRSNLTRTLDVGIIGSIISQPRTRGRYGRHVRNAPSDSRRPLYYQRSSRVTLD